MPGSNNMQCDYPYRVIGEHFQRATYNGQAVIMVDTHDGKQRDAIASLLLQLPHVERLFHPRDLVFIQQAVKRAEQWLNNRLKKVSPHRPQHKQAPSLRVINNHHFAGYRKR